MDATNPERFRETGELAKSQLVRWRYFMPGKKHVRGVGPKEQRQYEHILESAQKEGRYGKRAKEVAARTVLKHHEEAGHSKGE